MAKSKKTEKEKSLRIQLTDFIYREYDVTYLPNYFFINLDKIYKGTYKNLTEPIPIEDLFYMWQKKMDDLNKTYEYNKQHGKDMCGVKRISYDLAILLNKYDSFKRWKDKQSAIHEQEKVVEQQYQHIKSKQNLKIQYQPEEEDISSLIDEI